MQTAVRTLNCSHALGPASNCPCLYQRQCDCSAVCAKCVTIRRLAAWRSEFRWGSRAARHQQLLPS